MEATDTKSFKECCDEVAKKYWTSFKNTLRDDERTFKEWISVKDKLPKQGKNVLIYWKNSANKRFIDVACIWKGKTYNYNGGWHFSYCDIDGSNMLDDSQVTHWMPLPKPPKQ